MKNLSEKGYESIKGLALENLRGAISLLAIDFGEGHSYITLVSGLVGYLDRYEFTSDSQSITELIEVNHPDAVSALFLSCFNELSSGDLKEVIEKALELTEKLWDGNENLIPVFMTSLRQTLLEK